jgi:hypothetical protein
MGKHRKKGQSGVHPAFPNIEAPIQAEIMGVELDVAYGLWNSGHTPNPTAPIR